MAKLSVWVKPAGWGCAAAVVLATLAWRHLGGDGVDRSKVYKIGYGNDIPFHFKGPDGVPTGVAVDLVREAARRKKIKLDWIELGGPGVAAGPLDLWTLMTIRPERLGKFYFTRPYLQTETCFIVASNGPIREVKDLETAKISFLDYGIHRMILAELLPQTRPVPVKSSREALEKLASGLADAAYLDEYAALPALLGGGFQSPMRILPSPGPKSRMALASTFGNERAADAIRNGMNAMALDGSMERTIERWGLFPNLTSDMAAGLLNEQRIVRFLTLGILLLGLSLGASLWLLGRLRRQTIRLRRSEELLSESRTRLLLAVDLARLAPWEYDPAADQLTFEESLERNGGPPPAPSRTASTSIPDYLRKFVPTEDHALVAREIAGENAGDGSAPRRLEHRFLRPDGSTGVVIMRYSVVKDSAGRTVKTYGVRQDVTEARRAEEARRGLETQLQEARKLESLGTLAGGIAHEFNNLLVAILGHAEMARREGVEPAELEDHLARILTAGQRAALLVQQMLSFSKRRDQDRGPAQAGLIVDQALSLLRPTLPAANHFRERIQEGLPDVSADAIQVHQVMVNLCANAAHAMKGIAGDILVSADRVAFIESDPRPHTALRPGEYVRITVRDTGRGMDGATMSRIFEPFFTTKAVGEGAGLGLSAAHGLIRANDGVITVESKLGVGSTFSVYLPAAGKTASPGNGAHP